MKQTSILTKSALLALVAALALTTVSCEEGDTIETIGGHNITTSEFQQHYNTSVEIATRISNAEKATLYKLICNPSLAPNPQYQDMAIQLQPEQNYRQFRDSKIIEIVAGDEGFLDRPIVQQILEHTKRTTIAQLYLHEKVWERIKISEEDKKAACQELREKDPRRVGPLPLDDCLKVAEGMLKSQKYRREVPQVYEEIKEKIKISKNDKFDKEDFFEKDLELYQTIKSEGGCEDRQVDTGAIDNSEGPAITPRANPGGPGL